MDSRSLSIHVSHYCYSCSGAGLADCWCNSDENCQFCGGRDKVLCPECNGVGLFLEDDPRLPLEGHKQ